MLCCLVCASQVPARIASSSPTSPGRGTHPRTFLHRLAARTFPHTCLPVPLAAPLPSPPLPPAGARVFGGDKAKTRKVAGLHNDVAALESALESAKSEYERVKGRNLEVGGWGHTRYHY